MAHLNTRRIRQVAQILRTLPPVQPLNFYSVQGKDGVEVVLSDMYPPLDAPYVHDFFWFATMHQFGFWHSDESGYLAPLFGKLGGKEYKGSDLLWRLILRACVKDPDRFAPAGLASMTRDEFIVMFSDDEGPVSLLATEERYQLSRSYGQWFVDRGHTPAKLIAIAQGWKDRASTLLHVLAGIPGYKEDPLQKKALLLLMVETNRPEHFITPEPEFMWPPIIDYHLMRAALRMGLVTLRKEWGDRNAQHLFVSASQEKAIRERVYGAFLLLMEYSGRTMAEIDANIWLLGRSTCLETKEPLWRNLRVWKRLRKKNAALSTRLPHHRVLIPLDARHARTSPV